MLKELLGQYDHCKLECDGLTRVLHTVLSREGIDHTCMVGTLAYTTQGKHISLHFWIELPNMQIVDYRARMWLGNDPTVPHGIFDPKDYPNLIYSGNETQLEPLPLYLFDILTNWEI